MVKNKKLNKNVVSPFSNMPNFPKTSNVPNTLKKQQTTPKSTPTPKKPTSIQSKDFDTIAEYEQAKRRHESANLFENFTPEQLADKRIAEATQEAEINRIIKEKGMLGTAPELLNAAQALGTPNLQNLTPEEPYGANQLNFGQVAKTGATQAAVGGAAGALIGGGVGAIPGAVGGFIKGAYESIKKQTAENIAVEQYQLSKAERYFKKIVTDTNSGGDPSQNLKDFQSQLDNIDAAHSKLKQIVANKPLGEDATEQLAEFEYFDAYVRPYWINEMQQAIYNPNPSKILLTAEDLPTE